MAEVQARFSPVIQVRVHPALHKALQEISAETKKSLSDLAREALQAYVGMYRDAKRTSAI